MRNNKRPIHWQPTLFLPRLHHQVLPDFASLLCSVSPDLVEPSPGGSQAGTGPVVSSAASVSGVLPIRVPAEQVVPRDSAPTVPDGWDQAGQVDPQVSTRRRLLEHHPALAPLLGPFAPQAERVTPDDRVDSRLSSRSSSVCPWR
jgi:hypothetical protein